MHVGWPGQSIQMGLAIGKLRYEYTAERNSAGRREKRSGDVLVEAAVGGVVGSIRAALVVDRSTGAMTEEVAKAVIRRCYGVALKSK